MGNFYVNFTVKAKDAEAIKGVLRRAKRDAFIAYDAKAGCVVVIDREAAAQDPAATAKVGKLLSKSGPVLAASNEDDDIFRYWLFDQGKLLDSFDSSFENVSEQDFRDSSGGRVIIRKFDPNKPFVDPAGEAFRAWKPAARRKSERGGNVRVLTQTLEVPAAAEKVMKILLKDYDFVLDQHRAFCKALGLSAWAVGAGFEYVLAGQLPKGLRKSQVERVSAGS